MCFKIYPGRNAVHSVPPLVLFPEFYWSYSCLFLFFLFLRGFFERGVFVCFFVCMYVFVVFIFFFCFFEGFFSGR